jgi:hypothetical protein
LPCPARDGVDPCRLKELLAHETIAAKVSARVESGLPGGQEIL